VSWIYVEPDEAEDIDGEAFSGALQRMAHAGRAAVPGLLAMGPSIHRCIAAMNESMAGLGLTWNGREIVPAGATGRTVSG
jgi:hypothetical protein